MKTPPRSAPSRQRRSAADIRHILVPVDFSEASAQALGVAVDWAERFSAALHLMYVVEPPTVPQWGYAHLALREGKLRKEADTQMSKLRKQVPSHVEVSMEVRSGGGAEHEICDLARQRQVDLIVIGSHGAGRVRRALMGSTAERVVRHAPCPVLVVRD